jgi:transcriptional regulator with AAA-type ATPase domain
VPDVLLTFTGFKDPYWDDPVGGGDVEGPILSLLRVRRFDRVVLFGTPAAEQHTNATLAAIRERFPDVKTELAQIQLDDPTSYAGILDGLRACLPEIRANEENDSYYVATASGTPQMHASWLLLVASGELPARLLHIRPPRFVENGKVLVSEIDLDPSRFPVIRPPSVIKPTLDGEDGKTLSEVIDALGIVGDHPALRTALERAALLAQADISVLILGESGTGKEKFAELVHRMSGRARKPLEKVNCAAIPHALAESHLFGHIKGAFTGADAKRKGAFDAADGGTLFLDEFAELPLETQAKLLRAIDNGEIQTVGETSARKVDVRIIVATNGDLQQRIADREFRADLYHRINVGCVEIPPLRERRSDIAKLAFRFLDRFNEKQRKARRFTPEALIALERHAWPGNVRELQNAVTSSAILARDGEITRDLLNLPDATAPAAAAIPEPHEGFSLDAWQTETRDLLFERAMDLAAGNQTKAAKLLGVTPQAVSKWGRER